jgi:hypothetical protein
MLKSSSLCLYSSNLSTFWLKIEQFWLFEEISIFSNGGHLGYRTELFNIYYGIFYELWTFTDFDRLWNLKKRGDEIKKKSEISIFSNGGHLGYRTALTDTILKGDHIRIISAKFGWNWLSSFRGEDFFLISSPLFFKFHNRSKSVKVQSS